MAALEEGPYGSTVDRIALDVEGVEVEAIHARPDGVPLAGISLFPDIAGVRALFDDLARRLATHGIAVCAVEPFARVPADERATMAVEDRLEAARDLSDEFMLASASEAAAHLEASDGVHGVCAMGFCIGGYYTLKAASTGRYQRAVSFYGMIRTPPMWEGPGHGPPLESVADACPTLVVLGDEDPWVPPDDIEMLRREWDGRPDCKVVVYRGADHGFVHDPERPAHRPDDAADAWRQALSWIFEGED